jgi:hypothetical protein
MTIVVGGMMENHLEGLILGEDLLLLTVGQAGYND